VLHQAQIGDVVADNITKQAGVFETSYHPNIMSEQKVAILQHVDIDFCSGYWRS
jgi:hypothetical protein